MSTETSGDAAPAAASKLLWATSIVLACAFGWVGYNFPPKTWRIPDDMSDIGALSPKKDQDRLAAVVKANLWNNTLLKFSLAGLGLGVVGLAFGSRDIARHWMMSAGVLVSGLVAGALSGTIGLLVRQYLDLEYDIPLISYESRPMFCDGVVFAVISTLLLVPVAILLYSQSAKADRNKAFSIAVVGLMTGFLVPFISGMVLHASTTTSFYPPTGLDLTAIWFATMGLMTVVLCVLRGSRSPKPSAAAELGAA